MSARKFTFRQAAEAFRKYEAGVPKVILAALDRTALVAQRLAVTKFMQGLGRGKNAQPPNPPPGPLGIRTGKLRRGIKIVKARKAIDGYSVGLTSTVDYGAIQEFGGRTRAHVILPRKGKLLRFVARGGDIVFARRVNHPGSKIPARPHMRPALELAAKDFPGTLETGLRGLEDRLL